MIEKKDMKHLIGIEKSIFNILDILCTEEIKNFTDKNKYNEYYDLLLDAIEIESNSLDKILKNDDNYFIDLLKETIEKEANTKEYNKTDDFECNYIYRRVINEIAGRDFDISKNYSIYKADFIIAGICKLINDDIISETIHTLQKDINSCNVKSIKKILIEEKYKLIFLSNIINPMPLSNRKILINSGYESDYINKLYFSILATHFEKNIKTLLPYLTDKNIKLNNDVNAIMHLFLCQMKTGFNLSKDKYFESIYEYVNKYMITFKEEFNDYYSIIIEKMNDIYQESYKEYQKIKKD